MTIKIKDGGFINREQKFLAIDRDGIRITTLSQHRRNIRVDRDMNVSCRYEEIVEVRDILKWRTA